MLPASKIDPSRTTLLRAQFERDMVDRFDKLMASIKQAVVEENILGLSGYTYNSFRFDADEEKVQKFDQWLKQQINKDVLEVTDGGPWTNDYVKRGYGTSVARTYTAVRKPKTNDGLKEFRSTSVPIERLKLLQTRSFNDLAGVTKVMRTKISNVLVEGLLNGDGIDTIAEALESRVKGIGVNRAKMIAHNEIVRANAEGAIDAMEQLGVQIGVNIEFTTAGGGKVCPTCSRFQGVVLTPKQARGLFPLHVYCRCSPVPIFKPATKNKSILKRIKASVR